MAFFAMLAIGILLACFAYNDHVYAVQSVPYKMNFQGRLHDATGTPLSAGNYNMKFRIYSAPTGGTLLWSEQRANSTGTGVTVTTGGLFSIQLGDVSSLPVAIFNSATPLYFEVELPTPATAMCTTASCESYTEGAMTPRNPLGSSAYAFNSDTLDGLDSSAFAQLSTANSFTNTLGVTATSTTAFSVAGSSALLTVDTTGSKVVIGTSDAVGAVLVLDTKTNAGDPTGTNGAMYYNSSAGKLRCYQGGWIDCIPSATLQNAYDNSSSPATLTTTAAKGVNIVASAAPTTNLFTVDNTANPTITDNTSAVAIKYAGGSGAIEGSGMRVDYLPGTTSGSTWSGMRVVAASTGAASGVASYGIKLEGPTTAAGGTNTAIKIASGWDIGLDIGSGGIQLTNQGNPQPPAAGTLMVYAKTVNGRQMLKAMGPSGIDYPLQPSLFQNQVAIINVQSGTVSNYFGTNRAVAGTGVSAAFDEDYGYMAGYSTGTTVNTSAGISNSVNQFARGSKVGANGFFTNVRGALKDASYSGGVRIAVGMTNQTIANSVAAQNPTGSRAAFSFDTGRGDVNWMFSTKDGTTENLVDTGMPFSAATAYDWYIYTPAYPNNGTMYWRIDNMTTGATQEGSTTANLPAGSVAMRMVVAIRNLSATAQTISYQRIYVESDR